MRFFNKVYESWRDTQIDKYRVILDRIGKDTIRDKRVIDIGSASGFLYDFFQEMKINVQMVCADVDKSTIKQNPCPLKIICDGESASLKEGVFDMMFCIDVAHLLEELDTYPLKREGILILGLIKRHENKFTYFLNKLENNFEVVDVFEIKGKEEEKVAFLRKK